MTSLVRATQEDIPRKHQWLLSAVWDIEYERAKQWLIDRAAENIGKDKATYASARDAGAALPSEVYHAFVGEEMNYSPQLMSQAEGGQLGREAPSPATLTGLLFAKIIFMSIESLIFFWIWLKTTNTPPMTIVMGVALALIAFIAGRCAGLLLAAKDKGESLAKPGLWFGLVAASVLLVLLTWSRSPAGTGRSAVVWIVTGAVAVGIVVLEMLHTEQSARFKDRRSKMFNCQQWYANRKHKRVFDDGFWKQHYETTLRSINHEMGRIFDEKQSAPAAPPQGTPAVDGAPS